MLEGLDQINWHTLSHAYGEADDVPIWLKELAILDEHSESDALDQLSLSLSHQGTVYSASVIATPFLLELLTIDAVRCKASLLGLLLSQVETPTIGNTSLFTLKRESWIRYFRTNSPSKSCGSKELATQYIKGWEFFRTCFSTSIQRCA